MSTHSDDRDEPRVKRRRHNSQSPRDEHRRRTWKDNIHPRSSPSLEKEDESRRRHGRSGRRSRSPLRGPDSGSDTDSRRDRRSRRRSRDRHRNRDRDGGEDGNRDDDRGQDRDLDQPIRSNRKERRQRSRSRDRYRERHRLRDRSADRHHKREPRDDRSRRKKNYSRSRSHSQSTSPDRRPRERSKRPLPSQNDAFQIDRANGNSEDAPPQQPKQKPNFSNTGVLAAASNTVHTANQTIVLKYHEPPEARKPPATQAWRMYVFKSDEIIDTLPLADQTCWLFGREVAVCDVPLEHASCSKQHAVIQFRYVETRSEFGERKGKVRPYVLDLESTHGTTVNGKRIPEAKYVSLLDGDVVKFGQSSREYVMQLPPAAKAEAREYIK